MKLLKEIIKEIEKAKADSIGCYIPDYREGLSRSIDIIQSHLKPTRTITQNKALHLFFTFIADNLNEKGIEYVWTGIKGVEMSAQYNGLIVKEFIWKPIQKQLFGIDSTTQLTTQQINEVADVIIKALGNIGISIQFPSYDSWATSELIKKYNESRR
jgi:uncharacterized membrane protein